MILGIVGSRHFGADGPRRKQHVRAFIRIVDPIVMELQPDHLISGGQTGVDTLTRKYADWKGIPFTEFHERDERGRLVQRYHARDRRIARKANVLLALPCQHSTGTYVTVRYFEQLHAGQRALVRPVDCVTGEVSGR